MLKKIAIVFFVLVAGLAIFHKPIGMWLFLPSGDFSDYTPPREPDYSKSIAWAALPNTEDKADVVPAGSEEVDGQLDSKVDVFFLHPTTAVLGFWWNAPIDNWFVNTVTAHGILQQHASAFNGAAAIYAPRYRQITLGGYFTRKEDQIEQALDIAYNDTVKALDFYLANLNQGRPFIFASHSQGTRHGKKLLRYFKEKYPEKAGLLVAAYLIGNKVTQSDMQGVMPVCQNENQVRCFVVWNSYKKGGDPYLFRGEEESEPPVCVNPLSWKTTDEWVPAEKNLGSIPMAGLRGLTTVHEHVTGAQCKDGILWIDEPQVPGYTAANFDGGSYHTYDYNLFYINIRRNVERRVKTYLIKQRLRSMQGVY